MPKRDQRVSEKHETFIRDVMGRYDANKDGKLQADEVQEMMKDLSGVRPKKHQVRAVMETVDKDENDALDPDELYLALKLWYLSDEVKSRPCKCKATDCSIM